MSAAVRFWSRVDKSGQCWLWRACKSSDGYGALWWEGRKQIASRVAWQLVHGSAPRGCVLHRCDNPPCCNPAHLFLGTVADNNADRVAKKRTVAPRGERHGLAALSDSDVRVIRTLIASGSPKVAAARRFGVNEATIRSIATGRTWAWLS